MYVAEAVVKIEKIIAEGLDNDKLPPEIRLAELVGCSRSTVQRALKELAERGVIIRRHGYGTFLAGVDLPVDPRDSRRTYEQLADSMEKLIRNGGLTGRFPPYRQFALELGIGWENLRKAYEILREGGLIFTVRYGRLRGTYVTDPPPPPR